MDNYLTFEDLAELLEQNKFMAKCPIRFQFKKKDGETVYGDVDDVWYNGYGNCFFVRGEEDGAGG